jgi:hypothetical protein
MFTAKLVVFDLLVAFAFFGIPLLCFVEFGWALFSSRQRKVIFRRWILYAMPVVAWLPLCVFCLYAGSAAMRAAKTARTRNEMEQIRTAIFAYETEYDEPPPTDKNAALMKILTGKVSTGNPRGIAFLTVSPRDMNSAGEMVDAWQKPFLISLADPDHPTILTPSLEIKNGRLVPVGN